MQLAVPQLLLLQEPVGVACVWLHSHQPAVAAAAAAGEVLLQLLLLLHLLAPLLLPVSLGVAQLAAGHVWQQPLGLL
jgi:hypothetical protein